MRQIMIATLLMLAASLCGARAEGEWVSTASGCMALTRAANPEVAARWSGGCKNGKLEGYGTLIWSQTTIYGRGEASHVGSFSDGKASGTGVYVQADGSTFDGFFRDGELVSGSVRTSSGIRYDGELRDHEPHGRGRMVTSSGERYDGEYRRGDRHGTGTAIKTNGDRYTGSWRDGKPDGYGAYDSPSTGRSYKGVFVQGTITFN